MIPKDRNPTPDPDAENLWMYLSPDEKEEQKRKKDD
jgi:hypothetical protein